MKVECLKLVINSIIRTVRDQYQFYFQISKHHSSRIKISMSTYSGEKNISETIYPKTSRRWYSSHQRNVKGRTIHKHLGKHQKDFHQRQVDTVTDKPQTDDHFPPVTRLSSVTGYGDDRIVGNTPELLTFVTSSVGPIKSFVGVADADVISYKLPPSAN